MKILNNNAISFKGPGQRKPSEISHKEMLDIITGCNNSQRSLPRQPEQNIPTEQSNAPIQDTPKPGGLLDVLARRRSGEKPLTLEEQYAAAVEAAKQKAIAALKSPDPYEHITVINQYGRVLKEVEGEEGAELCFDGNEHTIIHGHPRKPGSINSDLTPPISMNDLETLNKSLAQEIWALDEDDNYSKVSRKTMATPEQMQLLDQRYYQQVCNDPNLRLYEDVQAAYKSGDSQKLNDVTRKFKEASFGDGQYPQKMHKFLVNNQKTGGYEYETNFPWTAKI